MTKLAVHRHHPEEYRTSTSCDGCSLATPRFTMRFILVLRMCARVSPWTGHLRLQTSAHTIPEIELILVSIEQTALDGAPNLVMIFNPDKRLIL